MPKERRSANINQPRVTSTTGLVVVSGGGGGGSQPGTLTGSTTNTITSAGLHYHAVQLAHSALLGVAADDHHDPVTVGNTGLSVSGQQVSLRLATVSGLEISSGLRLADSIAGDGLSIADKVLSIDLATNSGLQLSGSPAKLHLRTPSSVSATSTNTVTDALGHMHAVIASSNPGAASVLLKSDASGYLQLTRLGLGTAPDYPLHVIGAGRIDGDLTFVGAQSILTTADSLTLAPAADLDLTPGGTARVRATSGVRLQSDNYVSQMTGWGIGYNGGADFRYLYADELHAKSFVADLEQALAGGQIIAKSVAVVAQDFTVPATAAGGQLYVEDLPGAAGMPVFQENDWVRLRQFSRGSGSLTIADCWGVVTGYSDNGDGTQDWTFTRSSGAAGGTAAGTIAAKTLALDYGTTGNGFYEVNAIDGAWAENSPYAQVVTWATHPQSGQVVRSRWGNLKGIFNAANEYGLYAGDGVTDASKFLRISNEAIEGHNLPVKLYDGASVTVALTPGTNPSIALGNPIPTGWLTQDGFWAGRHTDGSYRQYVGEVSGGALVRGMSWDGSAAWFKGTVFIEDGSEFGAGNLMWDSSFELGKNSYTATLCEVARPTTNPDGYASPVSTRMLRLYNFGAYAYGDAYAYIDQDIPVAAGQQITVSFWATKGGTITGNSSYIRWSDGSHTLLGPSNLWTLVGTVANWTRHYYTFTVPAGITSMRLRFGTINTNQWWVCVDHIMVSYGDVPMAWAPGLWGGVIVDGASVLVGTPGGQRVELSADGLQGLTASDEYSFLLANDDIASWGGFSSLAAGDVVLGHNKAGSSAFFWDKSAGKGGFYGDGGATPQVEIGTDGAIAAGGGSHILNKDGFTIREAGDTYLYRYYDINDHLVSDDYVLIDESTPPAKYIYRDIVVNDDYYTAGGFRFLVNRGGASRVKLELNTFSPSRLTLNADVFAIFGGALNVGKTGIYGSAGDIYASGGLNLGTATGAPTGGIKTSGASTFSGGLTTGAYTTAIGQAVAKSVNHNTATNIIDIAIGGGSVLNACYLLSFTGFNSTAGRSFSDTWLVKQAATSSTCERIGTLVGIGITSVTVTATPDAGNRKVRIAIAQVNTASDAMTVRVNVIPLAVAQSAAITVTAL